MLHLASPTATSILVSVLSICTLMALKSVEGPESTAHETRSEPDPISSIGECIFLHGG